MHRGNKFHEYVMGDLFADLPGITSRPMFGGYGIYKNGIIFAIIINNTLYFKVGSTNKKDYESYSSEPFIYIAPSGRKSVMPYWRLPDEILELREEIPKWVDKSIQVSKNAKKILKRA